MDPFQTVTLTRLLSRLDRNLLFSSDPKLQHSQYERNRVGTNIEYARTLLLTAEKQSSTIRVQSQRQQMQADLQRKREQIKRLDARLTELNELNADSESDEEDDGEGTEGAPMEYGPARTDVEEGLDTGEPQTPRISEQQRTELRARRPLQASDNKSAASTTARENLFAGAKQHPDLQTTETLLSHNRHEQEALTSGLLSLASALKESSVKFSTSIEAEKDVLRRAEGGLEQSEVGMEKAQRGMGMLRRMTEGKGWWGRLRLYGLIGGLWVACFLLVFVGPKLRF